MGIIIDDFNEAASVEHRKLRQVLIAWLMDKLVASDRQLLSEHSAELATFGRDVSS